MYGRSELAMLLAGLLGVVVPAVVLHATAGTERHNAGLTAAPFAWPRLLVCQLATAVPLGLVLARWLARPGPLVRPFWVVIAAGVTVGAALLVCPLLNVMGDVADLGSLAFLLRCTIAIALVLPWCLVGMPAGNGPAWWALPVALLIAVVPAVVYSAAVAEARAATAEQWLETGRLVRAERVLQGLVEMGSSRPVGGQPPATTRRALQKQIGRLEQAAKGPLPAEASVADRFARAGLLIPLDRMAEAADLLRPLAVDSLMAALLLGAVQRDRERWADSDEAFMLVLDRLMPQASTSADAQAKCRTALEGLAFNARNDRRPADAERALQRGLDELPGEAARFHLLLGQHYHDGGRPELALQHLEAAVTLDRRRYGKAAEKLIRTVRTQTYGCLLRSLAR